MDRSRFLVGLTTALVSGVVGVVYGWSSTTQASGLIVWFVYGAMLGITSGALSRVLGKLLLRLWSTQRQQSLVLNLALGVLVGLSVGLFLGRDVLLCAMAGEVGALLMSDHSAELGHI